MTPSSRTGWQPAPASPLVNQPRNPTGTMWQRPGYNRVNATTYRLTRVSVPSSRTGWQPAPASHRAPASPIRPAGRERNAADICAGGGLARQVASVAGPVRRLEDQQQDVRAGLT